jgi:hypothetical protein
MTSSRRCSSSRACALAALLAAAALAGCRHAPPRPAAAAAAPVRIAVFPVQNATGGTAPVKPLRERIEGEVAAAAMDAALREAAARGRADVDPAAATTTGAPRSKDLPPPVPALEVVSRRDLEAVLAANRIRWTGGVDSKTAKALREELGVRAVLVPTLEQWSDDRPPRIALSMRLVSVDDRPVVLWADSVARAGDDSPGFLGLGVVATAPELEGAVVRALAASLERYARGREAGASCGTAGRFAARRAFRAPVLDDLGRRTVAVLPFTNETSRRGAGEVLAAQLVTQLVASGRFEVLDDGALREQLLANRIVLEGGVSVDHAMALLELLQADLVLSGYVQLFEAPVAGAGAPRVEFTTFAIDAKTAELVWSSAAAGAGDDGVFFFDAGRVRTGSGLACLLARGVADGLRGPRAPVATAGAASDPKVCPPGTRCAAPPAGGGSEPGEVSPYYRRGRARDDRRTPKERQQPQDVSQQAPAPKPQAHLEDSPR